MPDQRAIHILEGAAARRSLPSALERYERAVSRTAEGIERDLVDLHQRLRAHFDAALEDGDRQDARRLVDNYVEAMWSALCLLPALDRRGNPRVDERGHLFAQPSIEQHFHEHAPSQTAARLGLSLGILDGTHIVRGARFRLRYELNSEERATAVSAIARGGWRDGPRNGGLALTVVADAVAAGEILPFGVELRVVRAKLPPDLARRKDATEAVGQGGSLLRLETLLNCKPEGGDEPVSLRVLDEQIDLTDAPTVDDQLDRTSATLNRSLALVAKHLPTLPRVAVVADTLPLGPCAHRNANSYIVQPGADRDRAGNVEMPTRLFDRVRSGHPLPAGWTVVALGRVQEREALSLVGPHRYLQRQRDEPLVAESWGVALADGMADGDVRQALARLRLMRGDRYWPRRAAGHVVAFDATNNPTKVSSVMQALLAYTVAETLEHAAA